MRENIDECCFKFGVCILPYVLEEYMQREEIFDLFGADVVAIVSHICEIVHLGRQGLAFPRENLRKLLHLIPSAIVVYVKLPI
jgi:hypothetical protein